MAHVTYPPSGALDTLYAAAECLSGKGATRLARRVDIALERIAQLEREAASLPYMPPKLGAALQVMRSPIQE